MQISSLNPSTGLGTALGTAAGSGSVEAAPAATAGAAPEAAPAAEARPAPAAPLRRGLSNWNHQLQGQVSAAQQALDFLEQSASQLQALRNELLAKLDAQPGSEGQVQARVRQFSDTWRQRQRASAGALDPQLEYGEPGQATQRFSIRGLNMANLQAGGNEMLSFSVAGASQSLRSVVIEPGLSEQDIAARFDQALAPAKIRVALDATRDGALVFSTPESSWAGVRDTLAVRGGGIRFPTGQMNRVKVDPEAAAVEPDNWSDSDGEALRRTLREVSAALAQVERARASVSRALAQATSAANAAQPDELKASMQRLADNFGETAANPDYATLLSLTASLSGVTRERVVSLLSLR